LFIGCYDKFDVFGFVLYEVMMTKCYPMCYAVFSYFKFTSLNCYFITSANETVV